ncbi:MAG: hypothetical protein ACMUIE_06980 [Thermoplasmatota archaeon]
MSRKSIAFSLLVLLSLSMQWYVLDTGSSEPGLQFFYPTDIDLYTVLGRDDALSIYNSRAQAQFGASLSAGDIDGDGLEDIAVGCPDLDLYGNAGAVMIYFGRDPDEIFPLFGHLDCDVLIYGSDADDRLGQSIFIEDMSGDGRAELIIGAPGADGPSEQRRDSGEVYVVSGRSRGGFTPEIEIVDESLFARVYGRDGGDHLGIGVTAGDLNGDDEPELIIRNEGQGGKREPGSEYGNEAIGSWEIDVISGNSQGIGVIDIRQTGSLVRYFGAAVSVADQFASHIGNGLDTGDINGDGAADLVFSYRFDGDGYVAALLGGPSFPGVAAGSSVAVHNGADFSPDVTIDLGSDGFEVASVSCGELNGDPMDDLVIGLPYAPAWESFRRMAGQADIYFGSVLASPVSLGRGEANVTFYGIDSSDMFGYSTTVFDQDGDGMNELLISLPNGDGIDNLKPDSGEAILFDENNAFTGSYNISDGSSFYMGGQQYSGAFTQMVPLQFNSDPFEEIMISSPGYQEEVAGTMVVGLVSLFTQKRTFEASFVGMYDASAFGTSLVIDDFDQDGYEDMVFGDPLGGDGRPGSAHLFFGDGGGWSGRYLTSTDSDLSYSDAADVSDFGKVMTSGYLNNDNYPDLVIGAPMDYVGLLTDAGTIHVYWGGARSYMSSRPNLAINGYLVERVGSAVAVGDFNGDGQDDLALSTPYDTGIESNGRYHAGVVYIMFGPLSGSSVTARNVADVKIMGTADNEFIGDTLAADDIDNDGIDDLLIGAPKSQAGSITRQGVTYILKGRNSWASEIDLVHEPSVRIFGPWPFDEVGTEIETGDIDGDGKPEVILGSEKGDGFQRISRDGGVTYILKGEYVASVMPSANISLRTIANTTIFGDKEDQKFGSALSTGDVNGDGRLDLFIGAKGWKDPLSGIETGSMAIFLSELFSDDAMINSTSLPVVSGFSDQDQAGSSLFSRDVNSDGKADILIGAPGADPLLDGNSPGGAFYWEGKDLFYREVKSSPLSISGARVVAGELGRTVEVLEPGEGPYIFSLSGRSISGYTDITSLSVILSNSSLPGSAVLRFDAASESISLTATGAFENALSLDKGTSYHWNDGIQTWFVNFGVKPRWSMPEPDKVFTEASTASVTSINYLSDTFMVDKTLDLDLSNMKVLTVEGSPVSGWLKNDTVFSVHNVTLVHGMTGTPLGPNATEGISLGLFRPPGALKISNGSINGSQVSFGPTVPGDGIWGPGLDFTIGQTLLPGRAEWLGNGSFRLDVDTIAPPEISSFTIFPDGKEAGSGTNDDDIFIEVSWLEVLDLGGSGISNYTLEIINVDGALIESTIMIGPGDLLQLPEGTSILSLSAFDKAGNRGPRKDLDVLIDVAEPRFLSPFPAEGQWIAEDTNSFSIQARDTGSGLDPNTAAYRVYVADSELLSDWMSVAMVKNLGDRYQFNTTVPMDNGYGNYIQWKVDDAVGITSVSPPYSYNVDTDSPVIELPAKQMTVGPDGFILECYIEDTLSGLDLGSISYRIASQYEFWDSPWIPMGLTGSGASSSPSVDLLPGYSGWGYAQWSAEDIAGNLVASEIISVYIDRNFPVFQGFDPNGTSKLQDTDVTVNALIEEEESGISLADVEYSLSTISGWIQYGVGGFSPWLPVDSLEDRGAGVFEAAIDVELDEGPFNRIRFRAMDQAGNGWVISSTITLEVIVTVENLPPTALFQIIPAVDFIYRGDMIILDGSTSSDPEGSNLTFTWFSDLEDYPYSDFLGSGEVINISLDEVGVHKIWLEVTDGENKAISEEVLLRVRAPSQEDGSGDEGKEGWLEILEKALPYLIIALLIGVIIGGMFVYLLIRRRQVEGQVTEEQPLVDAEWEPDFAVPYCPYCGEETRATDEYCMMCGQVFSEQDKERMIKDMEKRKKGKKTKKPKELLPEGGEEEEEEDWGEELFVDEEELEGDLFADTAPVIDEDVIEVEPPKEEEVVDIMEGEEMEFEEFEDLEDVDELDLEDEDEDWEVDK